MKRILLLFWVSFLIAGLAFAQRQDTTSTFEQLKNELKERGVDVQDIKNVERPLKEMLNRGATKEDLKKVVSDLSKKGIKGDELKSSVEEMNELVKSGETPKEAGNIVSQAAHQAKAQGLKGKDLAAKVHEAIRQRKAERQQPKKQFKEHKIQPEKAKCPAKTGKSK